MNALSNVLPPNASAIAHTIAMPTRAGRVGTSRLSHAKAKTAAVPATVLFCHHSCARQSAQRCCPRAHARICACATRPAAAPARIAGSGGPHTDQTWRWGMSAQSQQLHQTSRSNAHAAVLRTQWREGKHVCPGQSARTLFIPWRENNLPNTAPACAADARGPESTWVLPTRKPLHGSLRVQYRCWPRLCKRKPWKVNGERLHPVV